jgi:hypothetical protein
MVKKILFFLLIFGSIAVAVAGIKISTSPAGQTDNAAAGQIEGIQETPKAAAPEELGQPDQSRQRIDKLLEHMGALCNCPRCAAGRGEAPQLAPEGMR